MTPRVFIPLVGLIILRLGVIFLRRIITGVIFLRRIITPGHYSTGVIIRRYTGRRSNFFGPPADRSAATNIAEVT